MLCQTHSVAAIVGVRTLPLLVAPVGGEALDSWLEAIADRYTIPLGEVMSRCGIRPTEAARPQSVSATSIHSVR